MVHRPRRGGASHCLRNTKRQDRNRPAWKVGRFCRVFQRFSDKSHSNSAIDFKRQIRAVGKPSRLLPGRQPGLVFGRRLVSDVRFSNRPFRVKRFQAVHPPTVLMSLTGSRFSSAFLHRKARTPGSRCNLFEAGSNRPYMHSLSHSSEQ